MDKLIIKHGFGAPAQGSLNENELGYDMIGGVLYIGTETGAVALASAAPPPAGEE